MLIPHEQLSDEALQNLVEEFVSRDGTDYGDEEVSLPRKRRQVLELLRRGEVVILFDEETGGCNILPRHQLSHLAHLPSRGR